MFKRLLNQVVVDLRIRPKGPILIKSGQVEVGGVDMSFVRTWRHGGWEPFLPGTSLKGMLRSHAERIARTVNPEHGACDPFSDVFCGNRFQAREDDKKTLSTDQVYRESCPICRLFGSTFFAGRFSPGDAYVAEGAPVPTIQKRDGVGIDRFTGGARGGAKFEFEVITEGEFQSHLYMHNVELWQLGLFAFLAQDLADGFMRLGFGKSRGLGDIRAEVKSVQISYLGPNTTPQPSDSQVELWGVGKQWTIAGSGHGDYGFDTPDIAGPLAFDAQNGHQLRTTYIWTKADSIKALWEAVAPLWVSYVKRWETPASMQRG